MYDKDYYERGLETGKSLYQNYRWIPELTLPLASFIIEYLGISRQHTILDFGCAKGYLVEAFRLLKRRAWGVDTSTYALSCVNSDVKDFCSLSFRGNGFPEVFDFCIAKDVFEHIPLINLKDILLSLNSKKLFVVVPLGKEGEYYSNINNLDITHIICEDEIWWKKLFEDHNWKLLNFSFEFTGMKEGHEQKTHGFFVLENKRMI